MYWYVGLDAIIYLVNAQLLNQTVVLSVVTQGFCALMKDCVARNCRQIFVTSATLSRLNVFLLLNSLSLFLKRTVNSSKLAPVTSSYCRLCNNHV